MTYQIFFTDKASKQLKKLKKMIKNELLNH